MSFEKTIFHKIRDKELPADIVYEDEDVLMFTDIHPKAKTHLLLIPKKDTDIIASISDMTAETAHVPGMLIQKAQEFAKKQGISGYKLLFNVGRDGGQEVFYLHLHFLSESSL